jgi:hypothetical protein
MIISHDWYNSTKTMLSVAIIQVISITIKDNYRWLLDLLLRWNRTENVILGGRTSGI